MPLFGPSSACCALFGVRFDLRGMRGRIGVTVVCCKVVWLLGAEEGLEERESSNEESLDESLELTVAEPWAPCRAAFSLARAKEPACTRTPMGTSSRSRSVDLRGSCARSCGPVLAPGGGSPAPGGPVPPKASEPSRRCRRPNILRARRGFLGVTAAAAVRSAAAFLASSWRRTVSSCSRRLLRRCFNSSHEAWRSEAVGSFRPASLKFLRKSMSCCADGTSVPTSSAPSPDSSRNR
mmetsp:Transcript_48625/g.110353  ORF Transcript_48625/g.110353 Transcript_48625/m.110353 type:complete len:237 (+) Transcript_48625:237-947(+)